MLSHLIANSFHVIGTVNLHNMNLKIIYHNILYLAIFSDVVIKFFLTTFGYM